MFARRIQNQARRCLARATKARQHSIQVGNVDDSDFQNPAVVTRDVVGVDDFGRIRQTFHHRGVIHPRHTNDGTNAVAELFQVHHRTVAGDDSAFFKLAHPFRHRWLAQVHLPPQLGHADAAIALQNGQNFVIKAIEYKFFCHSASFQ